MSDKELVRRCQADSGAFEEIMRRYTRVIFAYAMASTGSRQDAEEVTQDVFVKIYRAAHRFDSQYSFTTWLYKIASNTCKNKLRTRRHPAVMSLDVDENPPVAVSDEPGPLEVYSRNVEMGAIRAAIDDLAPRYREVLYLRYVEGLSYRDISEVLGLSLGNVEARIFRGKDQVRQKLLRRESSSGRRASDQAGGEP